MDLAEAAANFRRATRHCDNLIKVHRGYGGSGRGRRDEETSINRAVVVLAIASWQAVVQDLTLACVDISAPGIGSPLSTATYGVLAGRVRTDVGAFSTPNSQNARRLLMSAGFDPRPTWTWKQRGGQGRGMVTLTPNDASRLLDDWLKVRHAIAHGHDALPSVTVLQAVRQAGAALANPPIRLVDADQCLALLRRLARLTGHGLATHLRLPAPNFP